MQDVTLAQYSSLLERIRQTHALDLNNYAVGSLHRRIERFMHMHHISTTGDLEKRIFKTSDDFDFFISELTVNVTEMFRDPAFWVYLRTNILPDFRNQESVRIWHAGCSSGEEVFSMSILLQEEGLHDRTRILATDLNKNILQKAREGRYSLKSLQLNESNYLQAGGKFDFDHYYDLSGSDYIMKPDLTRNVSYFAHDLSAEKQITKADLIVCRNVLIYFNRDLQERVFTQFHNSLFKGGYIAIGRKETMNYYNQIHSFCEVSEPEKIYRLL